MMPVICYSFYLIDAESSSLITLKMSSMPFQLYGASRMTTGSIEVAAKTTVKSKTKLRGKLPNRITRFSLKLCELIKQALIYQ